MTQKTGVPLAVLTATQDNVERVNSALRDAGHPAHCLWVRSAEQLEETLVEEPELILQVLEDEVAEVTAVARLRDRYAPETPLVLIGNVVDEDAIAAAIRAGARDMVSFRQRQRLQAVLERELRNHRMERALNATLETATEYKRQLRAYMNQSADAIAYVQEGIVVDVNPAWVELFGAADPASLLGMPLMDSFAAASHGPLKGALVAAEKGKWTDDVLHARAVTGNEGELDVELELKKTEHDGEPAIRVAIAPSAPEGGEAGEMVQRALTADPSTGLLARRHFIDALDARLGAPVESGMRVLAWVKPDRFADVQSRVGIFRSEDVLAEFAALLHEELGEDELAGRFEGTVFAVLLERGSERDAERWGERLLEKVREHRFAAEDGAVSLTCTIGLCAATG
ncbi:MAG TPA: diguanylate cyclase [Woeseiaceae bacterium]|nr:diguanylate cyclase [Woeseiaceae bacterium]